MGKDGEGYLVMVGDQQNFFMKTSGLCADQMFNRRVSEVSTFVAGCLVWGCIFKGHIC